MRTGDKLLIDFDKLNPDLNTEWLDDEIFNANKVFDRANWLQLDNYIKYVKEEENFGIGGLNKGYYRAHDDWSLTIRTTAESEEEVRKVLDGLPHLNNFVGVIIE